MDDYDGCRMDELRELVHSSDFLNGDADIIRDAIYTALECGPVGESYLVEHVARWTQPYQTCGICDVNAVWSIVRLDHEYERFGLSAQDMSERCRREGFYVRLVDFLWILKEGLSGADLSPFVEIDGRPWREHLGLCHCIGKESLVTYYDGVLKKSGRVPTLAYPRRLEQRVVTIAGDSYAFFGEPIFSIRKMHWKELVPDYGTITRTKT